MDIPKDLQEKLEWMQKNRQLQEEDSLRQMKKKSIQEDSKQKSIRDTMNYMGGGKYNKKNHKNY
tara:strand:- start:1431 stop:1622 length:192 start_codon:yes stop_codon:yes gene_type:complete